MFAKTSPLGCRARPITTLPLVQPQVWVSVSKGQDLNLPANHLMAPEDAHASRRKPFRRITGSQRGARLFARRTATLGYRCSPARDFRNDSRRLCLGMDIRSTGIPSQ